MTMFWLDWKLFGNGCGLASPYFDDAFYWLSGRFYTWIGGMGAQLQSIEWREPTAGTRRKLMGSDFVVFQVQRNWVRVRVSWALARPPSDYAEVRALGDRLRAWGHGT